MQVFIYITKLFLPFTSLGPSLRGVFPNISGTSCWLASFLQAIFACGSLITSIGQHQRTRDCSDGCWQCALQASEASASAPGSATDLEPLWEAPLQPFGISFDRQQDPLEFLGKVAHNDLGALGASCVHHLHTLSHEQCCRCPIEMPVVEARPVPHPVALLSLPPFDETAALCLPDLLAEREEIIADGGLPCPMCKAKTTLRAVASWHLGPVVLLQLVRETDPGRPLNRTAVFAPHEFEHQDALYCLRAVVVHRGEVYTSGHYVAFVLGSDGVWVQYNDGDTPKRLPHEPRHLQTHARYYLYECMSQGRPNKDPAASSSTPSPLDASALAPPTVPAAGSQAGWACGAGFSHISSCLYK